MMTAQIAERINEQITNEAYSAQLYLQMALWCEDRGVHGAAGFFRTHVAEEMFHRDKLVDYMIESDAPVVLQAIPAPRAEYPDLVAVIKAAHEHEQQVTQQINDLARTALDTNDFSTFNMLQWFVAEQREELVLFRGIVDYVELSGFTGSSGDEMVNLNNYLSSITGAGQ